MRSAKSGARLLGLLALLIGCSPHPLQEPMLSVARADCDAQPDFAAALPVRIQDSQGTTVMLGAAGRCMTMPGGGATTYAVFALPDGSAPYTLEILSSVVPQTIVRPVATLYDAAGQRVRTVPPEEFEVNIEGLRAGVRPRGTERWVVVEADQTRLGQTLQLQLGLRDGRVQVAARVYVPIIIVPALVPDVMRQRSAIFALNGRITVSAAPARIAK